MADTPYEIGQFVPVRFIDVLKVEVYAVETVFLRLFQQLVDDMVLRVDVVQDAARPFRVEAVRDEGPDPVAPRVGPLHVAFDGAVGYLAVFIGDDVPAGRHDVEPLHFVQAGQVDRRFVGMLPDQVDLSCQGRYLRVTRAGRPGAAGGLDGQDQQQDGGKQ